MPRTQHAAGPGGGACRWRTRRDPRREAATQAEAARQGREAATQALLRERTLARRPCGGPEATQSAVRVPGPVQGADGSRRGRRGASTATRATRAGSPAGFWPASKAPAGRRAWRALCSSRGLRLARATQRSPFYGGKYINSRDAEGRCSRRARALRSRWCCGGDAGQVLRRPSAPWTGAPRHPQPNALRAARDGMDSGPGVARIRGPGRARRACASRVP